MPSQGVPQFIAEVLFGYRSAPAWWFEADTADQNAWMPAETRPMFCPEVTWVGRTPNLEWGGSGDPGSVPRILVTPESAYLRGDDAIMAFDRPPGLDRLEKVRAGRWVRTDSERFVRREGFSAVQDLDTLLRMVTPTAVEAAVVVGEDEPAGTVSVDCAGATWTLHRDGSGWSTDRLDHRYVSVRLGTGTGPRTPVVPSGEDVVDAHQLLEPLGLLKVPAKPTPTSADIEPPDLGESEWTVSHYELHDLLGVGHAVEAQGQVEEALRRKRSPLLKRLTFDSEALLFVAYGRNRKDAVALQRAIDELIREVPKVC